MVKVGRPDRPPSAARLVNEFMTNERDTVLAYRVCCKSEKTDPDFAPAQSVVSRNHANG